MENLNKEFSSAMSCRILKIVGEDNLKIVWGLLKKYKNHVRKTRSFYIKCEIMG